MPALTDIDVANQSLAMISARNTIASFTENTVEAKNVKIFYNRIRDQVMTMAWWNFARRTDVLQLFKAAPGTPENPGMQVPWTTDDPAPPWLYEYRYPLDCLLFRYITFRPNSLPTQTTPPISSTILSSDSWWPGPPQKFIVANDFAEDDITNIFQSFPALVDTQTNPAKFRQGDLFTITGLTPPGMQELEGKDFRAMTVIDNHVQLMDPVTLAPINSTGFGAYSGGGHIRSAGFKVILTNTTQALGCYTARIDDPNVWPAEFYNCFATALAAFLAFPISGKLDLKTNLLQEANGMIIEARRTDGNEGITNQDVIPDWIRVRGLQYQDWWGSGGVGWDQGAYTSYPPLFSVS